MTTPTDLDAGRCACWESCPNDAEPDSDMCTECLAEGCPGGRGDSAEAVARALGECGRCGSTMCEGCYPAPVEYPGFDLPGPNEED